MDKMREAFEAWATREFPHMSLYKKGDTEEYLYKTTQFAFAAWQASRAALKVELPPAAVAYSSVETLYTEDVCNMLEKAGISYE